MMRPIGQLHNSQASVFQRRTWSTATIVIVMCLLTLAIRVTYASLVPIVRSHDEWDHIAANLVNGQGYVSSWPKTYIKPS